MGSSFTIQNKLIKNVTGYGFNARDCEILSSIILELEDLYIFIQTGVFIVIKITDKKPNVLDETFLKT